MSKSKKLLITAIIAVFVLLLSYAFLYPVFFEAYTGVTNAKLSYDSSKKLTEAEFDSLVQVIVHEETFERASEFFTDETDPQIKRAKIDMLLRTPSFREGTQFKHIDYFREAGILQYEGPQTCLECHQTITVHHADGRKSEVHTLDDIVNSVHFKFQSSAPGFTTYGYDGRQVNAEGNQPIPVGKIDRACGIPGSFSWTGWAALIETKPEHAHGEIELRSEGCGQCHIGGNYHPATEKMMPVGDVAETAKEGIDCLICHSQRYDMNQRFVIKDDNGMRWNQDRSLKAALTVTQSTMDNCLNCHQHNMGGDAYVHNVAAKDPGYKNKRLLHEGAKRGNPFSPQDDVHAAMGMNCTDCHVPEGHKIPRGNLGTDLVSNDLPGKPVACETCHTSEPHLSSDYADFLNGHGERLACETCHITRLEHNNVVLRDWIHPTWNEEEGIYTPTDIYRSGEPGKGFTFLWFNGNGTFLANALGNNPDHPDNYNPLMAQMAEIDDPEVIKAVREKALELKKHYPDLDVDDYVRTATKPLTQLSDRLLAERESVIREKLRPVMDMGKSKIYPFKLFNAIMLEDMNNKGPFGAMILPFDYNVYYQTGNPEEAVKQAIQHPIVKRMYQLPFKEYMMDEFMYYFGVDGWKTDYPLQNGELQNVEAHWMRQMGTLMVNHGIESGGRHCAECHSPRGIMDFAKLGYPSDRVEELETLLEMLGIEQGPNLVSMSTTH